MSISEMVACLAIAFAAGGMGVGLFNELYRQRTATRCLARKPAAGLVLFAGSNRAERFQISMIPNRYYRGFLFQWCLRNESFSFIYGILTMRLALTEALLFQYLFYLNV